MQRGLGAGACGRLLLKLPEQGESLLGKDLKDLALLGAEDEGIVVGVCSAETEVFSPMS